MKPQYVCWYKDNIQHLAEVGNLHTLCNAWGFDEMREQAAEIERLRDAPDAVDGDAGAGL